MRSGQEDHILTLFTRHKDVSKVAAFIFAILILQGCEGGLFGSKESDSTPTSDQFTEPEPSCQSSAMPTQFIIRWKNGSITSMKAGSRREFIENILEKHKDQIEFAEHDYVVRLGDPPVVETSDETTEDDPDENLNWGIGMTKAESLWNLGEFGQNMVVAVIDSGVDPSIAQLDGQLFVNVDEVEDNGVDDDGNGFIDDVNGFDFFTKTNEIRDVVGHGSHVTGIIASRHDIGEVLGVAPGSTIIPLNFMDENGAGTLSDAVAAIDYAVLMGAKIINASWGGAPCSEILRDRITQLQGENVLFIAAAGNNGIDIEQFPEFPASFDLANQITVGASTINDFMAGFSNFSRILVDLVAPGQDIVSTVPESDPSPTKSGTSMATPFVTAAAAVIWGAVPTATSQQVKQALLESVDDGAFSVKTSGRLNIEAAHQRLQELVE